MAQRVNESIIGKWTVFDEIDDDGYLIRHAAAIHYRDGITLSFSIWLEGIVSIRLSNGTWRFRPGEDISISYETSDRLGQRRGDLSGDWMDQDTAQFDIEQAGQHFLSEIRRAFKITIAGDMIGNWDLDLTDSSAALREVGSRASAAIEEVRGGAQQRIRPQDCNDQNLRTLAKWAKKYIED